MDEISELKSQSSRCLTRLMNWVFFFCSVQTDQHKLSSDSYKQFHSSVFSKTNHTSCLSEKLPWSCQHVGDQWGLTRHSPVFSGSCPKGTTKNTDEARGAETKPGPRWFSMRHTPKMCCPNVNWLPSCQEELGSCCMEARETLPLHSNSSAPHRKLVYVAYQRPNLQRMRFITADGFPLAGRDLSLLYC